MNNTLTLYCSHKIQSESDTITAVISSQTLAKELDFDSTSTFEISTSTSELAVNILKYAGSGTITFKVVENPIHTHEGIEIEAVDHGPGIENIALALEDHFSTSGTLGLGLPGVQRMMDEFSITSDSPNGTRVWATKWKRR